VAGRPWKSAKGKEENDVAEGQPLGTGGGESAVVAVGTMEALGAYQWRTTGASEAGEGGVRASGVLARPHPGGDAGGSREATAED